MAILRDEDIVAHNGDVEAALKQKQRQAVAHLEKTGSMPAWWDVGVSLGSTQFGSRKGPPKKYANGEAFYSKGYEYFEQCATEGRRPTQSGLILHMGFTNNTQYHNYARRNLECRDAHATFQTWLQHISELEVVEPGATAGKVFILKNLPEGFATDDAADKPHEYPWRDKQQTELTGPGGGPLRISRELSPEEAYRQMLEGGVLEDKEEEEENSGGGESET